MIQDQVNCELCNSFYVWNAILSNSLGKKCAEKFLLGKKNVENFLFSPDFADV